TAVTPGRVVPSSLLKAIEVGRPTLVPPEELITAFGQRGYPLTGKWAEEVADGKRLIALLFRRHEQKQEHFSVAPIGYVRSTLQQRKGAPRQGWEGAPDARLEILAEFVEGLDGVEAGQEIWILTWLHESNREVLKVRPRADPRNPITGVFATRS